MTNSITPMRVSPGVTPDTHPSIATLAQPLQVRGGAQPGHGRLRVLNGQLIQLPGPVGVFASGGRGSTVLLCETPADMIHLDVWPSRQEDS